MIDIVVHPTFEWDIVLYSKSTIVKKRKVATQQCSKLITQLTLTLGLELPNKFTKPFWYVYLVIYNQNCLSDHIWSSQR